MKEAEEEIKKLKEVAREKKSGELHFDDIHFELKLCKGSNM